MGETLHNLEQKTAQLRAVGQISAALAAAWKLEDTLDAITRITSQVLGVDSCSIYLQEEAGGRLVLKATTGLAPDAIGQASLGIGEGLTGWVITHGQSVAVRDALKDPRFKLLPETHEEALRSLMAVPLSVQGRVIGAMNVQTAETHDYTNDEVELLSLIANLAAGAIEKAALYDRQRQQIQELSALAEVSRTVTSPLYLDEMLGIVMEMAARVMGAKATVLHLLDDASGQLVLRSTHDVIAKEQQFASIAVGQGIAGQVAATGQPIFIPNVQTDKRHLNHALAEHEGWISMLSVPLIVRDRIVGVFSCYMDAHHEFTPKEMELFRTLADQTALAIENARLVINAAVVREMHHRVKNNLQTIAMLLRLQKSAAANLSAEDVLAETINRIMSIAAIHEVLSEQGLRLVDVKNVLERVTLSIGETMFTSGRAITISVTGDRLVLASREATSLSLATSELVQNAVEHAFAGRDKGRILVQLKVEPGESAVVVEDDGVGNALTEAPIKGLGLQIVETLVSDDLRGHFESIASPAGTRAVIRFPNPAGTGAKP
ncbi:MAG: GAF domain-containing protein [Candidatus Eisenbacteria bacterium]|nr:GAF domain-containing protein [Candidatus Eisenbacteria bacterium]